MAYCFLVKRILYQFNFGPASQMVVQPQANINVSHSLERGTVDALSSTSRTPGILWRALVLKRSHKRPPQETRDMTQGCSNVGPSSTTMAQH